MSKLDIYNELIELHKKKDEHLKLYAEYIENLAKNKSTTNFMTGHCSECLDYEKQIEKLENELKILL